MRGTLHKVAVHVNGVGIIPAYAGNTSRPPQRRHSPRDHPRVCGEHIDWGYMQDPFVGSSPRMRGTPLKAAYPSGSPGIIPAYAGNTGEASESMACGRDHPRVCGEHDVKSHYRPPPPGSSPRMRGTHAHRAYRRRHGGIIPAYAGNTPGSTLRRCSPWDHPRVCGEHYVLPLCSISCNGSSPRMRGTRISPIRVRVKSGSSPRMRGTLRHGDAENIG